MALLNVLVTVPQPLRDAILTSQAYGKLRSLARVTMNEDGRNWTGPEIAVRLPGIDAMITGWGVVPLTAEVLAGADRLRLIAHAAGSVKGFVTAAVFDRGIAVSHAAARIAASVAEFTLTVVMAGLRRPQDFDALSTTTACGRGRYGPRPPVSPPTRSPAGAWACWGWDTWAGAPPACSGPWEPRCGPTTPT